MVQIRLRAGNYRFHGFEKCETGYHYDTKLNLSLEPNGNLTGTVLFCSSTEEDTLCPIVGFWSEDGRINYQLIYGATYNYEGFIHQNISAGKFWNCDESSTYELAATNVRGKYRHIQDGTNDNPEILKDLSNVNDIERDPPPPPSEDEYFTNVLQKMDAKTYQNYIHPGAYTVFGKETCESTYVYDAVVKLEFNFNGLVSGCVSFSSQRENQATNKIEGRWKTNGKYYYTLSYAGLTFAYEGVFREGITYGRFWQLYDNNTTYDDAQVNVKGVFTHTADVDATQDYSTISKGWVSEWFLEQ